MPEKATALSNISRSKTLKPTQGGFSLIPDIDKYEQNYIVHRINLPSIEVTAEMRNFIEQAMGKGKKFVRVGDHTLMINSINGIDPLPRKRKSIQEQLEGII